MSSRLCAVCGAAATSWCSRCKKVWYCTAEHQRGHWKAGHKDVCRAPVPSDAAGTQPTGGTAALAADPKAWSVKELKAVLAEAGVDSGRCVEKADLVQLVRNHGLEHESARDMAVSPIGSDATSPAANRLKAAQFLSEIDPDPSKRSSTSDRPLLEHGLTELEEEEEPWRKGGTLTPGGSVLPGTGVCRSGGRLIPGGSVVCLVR